MNTTIRNPHEKPTLDAGPAQQSAGYSERLYESEVRTNLTLGRYQLSRPRSTNLTLGRYQLSRPRSISTHFGVSGRHSELRNDKFYYVSWSRR